MFAQVKICFQMCEKYTESKTEPNEEKKNEKSKCFAARDSMQEKRYMSEAFGREPNSQWDTWTRKIMAKLYINIYFRLLIYE